MPLSRVTAGSVMIGGSIFLFLVAAIIDDPELPIGIEWRTFIETSFFITAVMLMGVGIYFVFSRPVIHIPHYGHNFNAPRSEGFCPYCSSTDMRRSHRYYLEKPLSILGLWPYRCLRCKARFRQMFGRHFVIRRHSTSGETR